MGQYFWQGHHRDDFVDQLSCSVLLKVLKKQYGLVLSSPVKSRVLDSMIVMGSFQLKI